MPPKRAATTKHSRSAPPAARAAGTAYSTADILHDVQELEALPDGTAYDSLDKSDRPPRSSKHLLVIDDEALLVGLDEYAPKENPDGEPPAKAPAVPA
eukprot:CAMPEP_0174704852 /NCGR_PEP_ID=MMETSP1094-20130205/8285_1 /TAXON_ID=156173 /ORGANISM="Chrysochromulina brevifilum, Strain UTEX LB 985" /LENGTH=97 /DNA_ID=CAMNT_0015902943 /DNA_START=127 /DNA_END=417 /DNA_ORIENTATION=+